MITKFFKKRRSAESDYMQQIGREAAGTTGPADKALLYAEVEDGVISADLFWQNGSEPVRFAFASADFRKLIYQFWQASTEKGPWATMTYVIENGRFDAQFEYPDALKPNEALHDRRPRVIRAVFGDAPVDYSNSTMI